MLLKNFPKKNIEEKPSSIWYQNGVICLFYKNFYNILILSLSSIYFLNIIG